jgi:hypothetical protein
MQKSGLAFTKLVNKGFTSLLYTIPISIILACGIPLVTNIRDLMVIKVTNGIQ